MGVSTDALRRIIQANFPALWPPTEAVLSTILAMVPDDVVNPPTCVFTGPSSSSKTTVLDFVSEVEGITYRSDRFSPKAFVSHAANVKRERLEEIDLLPRIRHRALVTPELAPMFRGKEDALTENFAVLTAVLDGHGYIGDSGTQGRRGYTGDYLFAWLGATTPLPTHVWRVMAQLGSRLFFYAMPDDEVTDDELDDVLSGVPYRNRVSACRVAVTEFLRHRLAEYGGVRGVKWDPTKDSKPILDVIKRLARLLAKLRGVVSVWQDRGTEDLSYTPPNIERPLRAVVCLYNLARGRALLYGRTHLTEEDLPLVTHVALSSMPSERARLFRALVQRGGILTTREAADALGASLPTARKAMKTLDVLGVALMTGEDDERYRLTLRSEWTWCLDLDAWETDTGTFGFQGGESQEEVCVSGGVGPVEEGVI